MKMTSCVLAAAAAAACSRGASPASSTESAPTIEATTGGAIVVELFTSQGCSSCPPADALLTELAADADGRSVIALAFHVDYWNDLGWRDPFSTPAATGRQETYAEALGRGLYTPQLVVNGRAHVVGSQRGDVKRALAAAALVPALPAQATLDGDTLRVTATPPPETRAVLALWENHLDTNVPAGENRGEQLRNDRVVRALIPLDGDAARVALSPAWRREHLGAVVLAHRADASIAAATLLDW